jgi:presenilin-like A22 family membrane protease
MDKAAQTRVVFVLLPILYYSPPFGSSSLLPPIKESYFIKVLILVGRHCFLFAATFNIDWILLLFWDCTLLQTFLYIVLPIKVTNVTIIHITALSFASPRHFALPHPKTTQV